MPSGTTSTTTAGLFALAFVAVATAAVAQESVTPCKDEGRYDSNQHRACEVRSYTMAAPQELHVDAGMNGGISLHGEGRGDVHVEAEASAWAGTAAEARAMLDRVKVVASGSGLRSEGPGGSNPHWSVSFHIAAPTNISSSLHANNGGISLDNVEGTTRAETTNGGLAIHDSGGDLHAETTNGGVSVKLSGSQWNGTGLDAQTTNGSVKVDLPQDYRAHLDASTVNGSLRVGFPITVSGTIRNNVSTDLNGGGPPLHFQTVNGSVAIGRD